MSHKRVTNLSAHPQPRKTHSGFKMGRDPCGITDMSRFRPAPIRSGTPRSRHTSRPTHGKQREAHMQRRTFIGGGAAALAATTAACDGKGGGSKAAASAD